MAVMNGAAASAFLAGLDAAQKKSIGLVDQNEIDSGAYDAVLFEGDSDALRELNRAVARRSGPIVSVQGLSSDELAAGETYRLERLLREVSVSINTAGAGGNGRMVRGGRGGKAGGGEGGGGEGGG